VAGGIPIIKALREGFTANRIDSVCGIMNGTCNYVLSRMEDEGLSYEEAVAAAQAGGFAEADPTLDVEGRDAQHKLGILALLAFGQWVPQKSMYVEGITGVTAFDIACAQQMGYTIKLLAIARADAEAIETRIHPAFIPATSLFANVKGAYNAIQVDGYPIGRTMFYGMGAGREPTSSAVVADIIDIARNIGHSSHERMPTFTFGTRTRTLRSIDDVMTQYYLRCTVDDAPGVIAQIAHELGKRDISLSSVLQHESQTARKAATVTFMTHLAREGAVREALRAIDALPCARRPTVVFRVELTEEEGVE
jgi:homoserine dehydrogenase